MATKLDLITGIAYLRNAFFGTGTATFGPEGRLTSNVTPVSNVGVSTETDLMTYTLPANSLSANLQGVRITAWGTSAANANAKTVNLYFGGTIIAARTNTASAVTWWLTGIVLRSGASAEQSFGNANLGGTDFPQALTLAVATSGTIIIKVTGTGVASTDLTQTGMLIEALP